MSFPVCHLRVNPGVSVVVQLSVSLTTAAGQVVQAVYIQDHSSGRPVTVNSKLKYE